MLLTIIGTLGSFFVVPLNALLQECSKRLVGAGNAIAVKNLGKKAAMLLGLELYSLVVKWNVPFVGLSGFGVVYARFITALGLSQRHAQ
ncbi:MAG: hypothetical protein G5700_00025 [Serratia symbiotica]|nr:hypothetical protein [Serratia symbiotica]